MLILFWGCARQKPKEKVTSSPQIDSIQELLSIAKTAKELSLEDRKAYVKEAESKAMELSKDSVQLEQLSKISLVYMRLKDSLGFRKSNAQLLKLSEEAGADKTLGYSYWDLAGFLQSYGVMDSAFYHYKNALNSFEQLPVDSTSQSLRGRMLYGMARVQDSYKDYLGGEISATAAIKIFDELEDEYRLYNAYNVLGVLANGLGDSDKSLKSYEKAREYLDKSDIANKRNLLWKNQNNIASVYLNAGDFVKAKEAYKELLSDKDLKEELPGTYEKALGSLAYLILKVDKDEELAEELLNEAFAINSATKDLYDRARLNYFYAEILAAKGDSAQAIAQAKESYVVAKETYNNDRSLDALRLLTKLDTANANSYAEEYYQLNETIKVEERTKRDKFARIRMETDNIIEENQILTKEKQIWVGASLLLVLFGTTAMIIVSLYVSNSQLKFKQKQQESNQEIYNLMLSQQGKLEEGKQLEQKRISEELHDGILGEMLGIRLILSGLNEREDQASIEQRAALIEKLRELEEEIRTISHELNHASYEKFHNFIVSLEDMIQGIEKSSGISCSFTYNDKVPWDNLLGDIKINAYRIIQESLKNCVKHAKCQHVSISFQAMDNQLKLVITDDGVGFDINRKKKGIGLRNIISRTKKIQGVLDIDSESGKGTTIKVTIPVKYVELQIPEKTNALNA
ncbi:putative signal transduction histidine kinase [Allomuricauda ruestringensis DSM 13258]|uniref:histidine kinase n=1 Tax=Allomuricauda ruestringensis (strain DSM 13258 / CIP 107369 / LMG 19739 / B1) TaxID=886377 RepID=G2PNM6_ALLRU|nr:sensor histidine kinase [Allomuricauda ruestringensis]AEM72439.1 putative signal transduction histidine kinase [Allomuricauda ruestringensis DSM 13258]